MTDRIATAAIARWLDGDTLVVTDMDLGWGVAIRDDPRRQTTHIRLAGVNAPDKRPGAKWYDPALSAEATAYVNAAYPPGTRVVLVSRELDDFGRSLADVAATDPDAGVWIDIGKDLVARGFARTGDYPTPPKED